MWKQSQIPKKAMNGSFNETENHNENHYSGGNDDGRPQEWPAYQNDSQKHSGGLWSRSETITRKLTELHSLPDPVKVKGHDSIMTHIAIIGKNNKWKRQCELKDCQIVKKED